jgi:broad specificity phosphatase PhoE
MKRVTDIVFESHSTTTDNEAGIATGWLPGALSPTGRRQAVELGERRRQPSERIEAVFTSDLARAVETARIAFEGSGISIRQDARLRECNYGELNGTSAAALASVRPEYIDRPFPGGQSYRDVVDATADFLHDLTDTQQSLSGAGARVLVIAHSANRWALDVLLAGARLEDLLLDPGPWRPGWLYRLQGRAR